jgi:hypothetical protein
MHSEVLEVLIMYPEAQRSQWRVEWLNKLHVLEIDSQVKVEVRKWVKGHLEQVYEGCVVEGDSSEQLLKSVDLLN